MKATSPRRCAPRQTRSAVETGVGADRGELGTGEAGLVEERLEPVALVAVRLFTETGDDEARLRVDPHLAAVDEMRPLVRLAAQLRVRVAAETDV